MISSQNQFSFVVMIALWPIFFVVTLGFNGNDFATCQEVDVVNSVKLWIFDSHERINCLVIVVENELELRGGFNADVLEQDFVLVAKVKVGWKRVEGHVPEVDTGKLE